MKKTVTTGTKRVPDFTGVPGELIEAADLPMGLHFGYKLRTSPYDALLQKLADAGEGKALRFGDVKARVSVNARAKKLGLKVACAEADGVLFVRFEGRAGEELKTLRRERILGALKFGPATAIQVSVVLRGKGDSTMDGQMAEAILGQMARESLVVKQEGGTWTLAPRKRL